MTGDFQALQRALTAHLRDPEANPAPEGPEDRRIAIYRRLVFGNASRLLGANFPLTRKQLGKKAFSDLIRDFLREHRAETPYFPRMAGELRAWHQKARPHRPDDPPWLDELILYESEKRRLRNAADPAPDPDIDPKGDMVAGVPAPSPLLRLLTLRYPVHRSQGGKPDDASADAPSFLLLRRDSAGRMRTEELDVLSAGLLAMILDGSSHTGAELLESMMQQAPAEARPALIRQGKAQLRRFHRIGVLLGARARQQKAGRQQPQRTGAA